MITFFKNKDGSATGINSDKVLFIQVPAGDGKSEVFFEGGVSIKVDIELNSDQEEIPVDVNDLSKFEAGDLQ